LLEALNGLEDASWGDFRGRALTPHGLSRLLKPYAIKPSTVRFGAETKKGYTRTQFKVAWDRYVPSSSSQNARDPSHRNRRGNPHGYDADRADQSVTQNVTPKGNVTGNPSDFAGCDDVTDGPRFEEGEEGEGEFEEGVL
jgi:hypothetical protein